MKQTYHFEKYHGLGNDFILFDGINQRIDLKQLQEEVPILCNQHYGIGADGIIVALQSKDCDIKMKVFNKDGSCPEMCGNGLRCFASFVYHEKLVETEIFSVETDAGKMVPAVLLKNGDIVGVEIDMGEPQIDTKIMPSGSIVHKQKVLNSDYDIDVNVVSMGNPHAVVFVDNLDTDHIDDFVPLIQQQFPDGINIEFVHVVSSNHGKVLVWERGVGKTLACGTGACAAAVVGISEKKFDSRVTIEQPGGNLVIEWQSSDNRVIKSGPAQHVFSGQLMI